MNSRAAFQSWLTEEVGSEKSQRIVIISHRIWHLFRNTGGFFLSSEDLQMAFAMLLLEKPELKAVNLSLFKTIVYNRMIDAVRMATPGCSHAKIYPLPHERIEDHEDTLYYQPNLDEEILLNQLRKIIVFNKCGLTKTLHHAALGLISGTGDPGKMSKPQRNANQMRVSRALTALHNYAA